MKRNYFNVCFLSHLSTAARTAASVAITMFLLGASAVYADTVFTAVLNGNQAVPATNSAASGVGSIILNDAENQVTATLNLNGFQNTQISAEIHGPAPRGASADHIFSFPSGASTQSFSITNSQAADLKAGLWYFNVTSTAFPNGEIRGQIEPLCAPPPADMAAWYRAENNATDSISGNTAGGAIAVSYQAGKVGQAFTFNGTGQYANLGNFFGYRTFTISMWVKPGATQTAFANLVDNNRTSTANWGIEQNDTATNNYFYRDNGVAVPFILESNVWQHLTVVRKENEVQIYRNGILLNSSPSTTPINYDESRTLMLGRFFNRFNQGSYRFWKGQIDEFSVFNRGLNDAEIRNLYYSGNAGVCTDSKSLTERVNGKIVFTRRAGNVDQIYTVNNDGSDLRKISPNPNFNDQYPVFSPDGSKILFARNTNIYRMDADGSNPVDLFPSSMLNEFTPLWSPDGKKISFTLGSGTQTEIYVMNADGTNPTRLTNNSVYDFVWGWSPDGSKLAFNSRLDGNDDIYVMNADGSNPVRLTTSPAQDLSASWSPDGNRIAFFSNRSGNDIYVMNADGTNAINLTNTPSTGETYPNWSPDGTKIVFTREQNNSRQIWTMNANGSAQFGLLTEGINSNPSWHWGLKTQNTTVSLANGINVTFTNVNAPGRIVATPLQTKQMPKLPSGYAPGSPIYDIRTSVSYTNLVTVSFNIASVTNESICSNMRVMHFTEDEWRENNNAAPIFNNGVCTVSQNVLTLSPFMVAHINSAPQTSLLSGKVIYGTTPAGQTAKFVSNVSLTVAGDSFAAIDTISDGSYLLNNLLNGGQYTVTPAKNGSINGISPFDATLILRHVAAGGNGTLTPNQRLAADTNNSGTITPFDATLILRYVAAGGPTNATGAVGNWKFTPATNSYSSLPNSLSDQNYEAILIGEVNGNWMPPQTNSFANADVETVAAEPENSSFVELTGAINRKSATKGAQLLLDTKASRIEKGSLIIPVLLTNNSESISGFSVDVIFDSNILELDSIQPIETTDTLTANNFSVVSDTTKPGRIGIAVSSGADLITANGTLIKLRFKVNDKAKIALNQKTLTLSRTQLEDN
jgi:TolB protein